jgi:serine/threonine protein kinase
MVSSAFKSNSLLAKRTLREVAMLRRFHHENLISVLDLVQVKERLFLVIPLMDTDLEQIINSPQPLRHAHIVFIAFQTLKGLNYLHTAGIVHRDVRGAETFVFFFFFSSVLSW